MIRSLLLLVVLPGCSKVIDPIERANCTLTWEVDTDADGTTDWVGEYQYDGDSRLVQSDSEAPGLWTSVSMSEIDADGCVTAFDSEYIHVNGDQRVQRQRRTCDENGDDLRFEDVIESQGANPFDFDSVDVWDRTYGANGLTSEAVRTHTLREFDIDFVSEYAYEYDEIDRQIRSTESRDGDVSSTTTRVWFDDLGVDDLLASRETRDAFNLITSAVYRTYDDRGRLTNAREIDTQGIETSQELTWVDRAYALTTSRGFDADGEPTYIGTYEQDDDNPFSVQTVTFDNLPDGPDGTVDYRRIETWDCP